MEVYDKLTITQDLAVRLYSHPHPARLPPSIFTTNSRNLFILTPDLTLITYEDLNLPTSPNWNPPNSSISLRLPPLPPFPAQSAARVVYYPRRERCFGRLPRVHGCRS